MANPNELMLVPIEVLRVIPLYNGDENLLNLFLRKCEYVIDMYKGNDAQNLYLFHTITSRLVDKAANLLSERDDVDTWNKLKELLKENFSDSRSEESIVVDFQSLKINPYEHFTSFYNRLLALYKTVIAKIDNDIHETAKSEKVAAYNKMAITVLLYNLPQYLVRMVRLKEPNTLEEAYKLVMEEISFFKKYSKNHATTINTVPEFTGLFTNSFKPFFGQQSNLNNVAFGCGQTNKIQSMPNQQSTSFGGVSSYQSTQNQSGYVFGSTQSNAKPAGLFGMPKPTPISSQQNGLNPVKSNNVTKSLEPAFNTLNFNEEE